MMDLLLIENTDYVVPQKVTTSLQDMIVQSYVNLFLTHIGSIKYAMDVGINFKPGTISLEYFKIMVNGINNSIYKLIKDTFNITSCRVTSVSDDYKVTVVINGEYKFTI